jgi:hypothetical protein
MIIDELDRAPLQIGSASMLFLLPRLKTDRFVANQLL